MDIRQELKNYRFYSKKGNMDRAGIIIKELVSDYPNNPYVLFEYAIYLHKTKGLAGVKESMKILKSCIDNDSPNKYDCYYEFIKEAIFSNINVEYVVDYANILIANNYNLMSTEYYLALYFENRGLKALAIEHYKNSAELGYNKSKDRLKDFENISMLQNDDVINEISNSDSKSISELENKIVMLRKQGKFGDIRILLHNFEEKYTSFTKERMVNFLFKSYLSIGYFNDAINLFEKNKNNFNDTNFLLYIEARIDLINNNYKDAEDKFNQLINSESKYKGQAYLFLAQLANINKDYELENNYYDQLSNIESFKEELCLNKVLFNIRKNDKKNALIWLKKIQKYYIRVNQQLFAQIYALLGLDLYDYTNDYYTVKQIRNYNIDSTIEHVKRHTLESDYYDSTIRFNETIIIEDLIKKVQNELTENNLIYTDIFEHYIVKYDNAGSYDDINANFIEVVVIPNTKNIITMYPVITDNYFAKKRIDKEPKKVKRLSQIDKFNMRYNKNGR